MSRQISELTGQGYPATVPLCALQQPPKMRRALRMDLSRAFSNMPAPSIAGTRLKAYTQSSTQ